jgi:hypothetical protein
MKRKSAKCAFRHACLASPATSDSQAARFSDSTVALSSIRITAVRRAIGSPGDFVASYSALQDTDQTLRWPIPRGRT